MSVGKTAGSAFAVIGLLMAATGAGVLLLSLFLVGGHNGGRAMGVALGCGLLIFGELGIREATRSRFRVPLCGLTVAALFGVGQPGASVVVMALFVIGTVIAIWRAGREPEDADVRSAHRPESEPGDALPPAETGG